MNWNFALASSWMNKEQERKRKLQERAQLLANDKAQKEIEVAKTAFDTAETEAKAEDEMYRNASRHFKGDKKVLETNSAFWDSLLETEYQEKFAGKNDSPLVSASLDKQTRERMLENIRRRYATQTKDGWVINRKYKSAEERLALHQKQLEAIKHNSAINAEDYDKSSLFSVLNDSIDSLMTTVGMEKKQDAEERPRAKLRLASTPDFRSTEDVRSISEALPMLEGGAEDSEDLNVKGPIEVLINGNKTTVLNTDKGLRLQNAKGGFDVVSTEGLSLIDEKTKIEYTVSNDFQGVNGAMLWQSDADGKYYTYEDGKHTLVRDIERIPKAPSKPTVVPGYTTLEGKPVGIRADGLVTLGADGWVKVSKDDIRPMNKEIPISNSDNSKVNAALLRENQEAIQNNVGNTKKLKQLLDITNLKSTSSLKNMIVNMATEGTVDLVSLFGSDATVENLDMFIQGNIDDVLDGNTALDADAISNEFRALRDSTIKELKAKGGLDKIVGVLEDNEAFRMRTNISLREKLMIDLAYSLIKASKEGRVSAQELDMQLKALGNQSYTASRATLEDQYEKSVGALPNILKQQAILYARQHELSKNDKTTFDESEFSEAIDEERSVYQKSTGKYVLMFKEGYPIRSAVVLASGKIDEIDSIYKGAKPDTTTSAPSNPLEGKTLEQLQNLLKGAQRNNNTIAISKIEAQIEKLQGGN